MPTDVATLALVAGVFLLAGTVKGVTGLGLPAVSLGLLTATIGLQPALALLLIPSFATNLWQALAGGAAQLLVRRLWPFLLPATALVWVGAMAWGRIDVGYLSALLGTLLIVNAVIGLSRPSLRLPARHERPVGVLAGLANGILAGMTGSFVVPGGFYLSAIGLGRDHLVQALGILFTASTVVLAAALAWQGLLTAELGAVSLGALLPALAGMWLGQHLRRRLSEAAFRKVFLSALLLLGLYIVVRSLT